MTPQHVDTVTVCLCALCGVTAVAAILTGWWGLYYGRHREVRAVLRDRGPPPRPGRPRLRGGVVILLALAFAAWLTAPPHRG